MYAANMAGV